MQYTELPVFKAAYDLLLDVFKHSQHIKREYRYTLGEALKNEIMQLLMCVYRANITATDKIIHVKQAREHIEIIKLQIRLLHDLKQLPIKGLAQMVIHHEDISKQLTAWHKTLKTKAGQGKSL